MAPLEPPRTLKVYSLVKQSGLTFTYAGYSAHAALGNGFFATRDEAEHHRTLEVLKDTASPRSQFHVFEMEVPNPAYEHQSH